MDVLEVYYRNVDSGEGPELDVWEFNSKDSVIEHAMQLIEDERVEVGESYGFYLEGGEDPEYIGLRKEDGSYDGFFTIDEYKEIEERKDIKQDLEGCSIVEFGSPIGVGYDRIIDYGNNVEEIWVGDDAEPELDEWDEIPEALKKELESSEG